MSCYTLYVRDALCPLGFGVTVSQSRFALRLWERLVGGRGVSFNRVRYLCRYHVRTAVRLRISVRPRGGTPLRWRPPWSAGGRPNAERAASRERVNYARELCT